MQFHRICAGATLLRYLLARAHQVIFLYQQTIIVAIGAEVNIVMLDDQQLTETDNTSTRVYHLAIRHRLYGVTPTPADVYALVNTG